MNRKYLESLLVPKDPTQVWVKKTIEGRGHQYYGYLKHEFPQEEKCFDNMFGRARRNRLDIDFEYSPHGFIDFLLHIGSIPEHIIIPSVGRLDHERGYVKGNFAWEEKIDNTSEVSKRPEHTTRSKISIEKDARPNNPNYLKSCKLQKRLERGTIDLDPLMVEFEMNYANIRRAIRRFCEKQNLKVKFPYGKRKAVIC